MIPFVQASYLAQVGRLRELAIKALRVFPIRPQSVTLINHGENATFKVFAADGRHYVLRIHRNDYHSRAGIEEELSWIESLAKWRQLAVPTPLRSRQGKLLERVQSPSMNEDRFCCLFNWIEGRFIEKSLSAQKLYQLGKLMAGLQKSAIKRKTSRRYWTADGLLGDHPKLGSLTHVSGMKESQRLILDRLRKETFRRLRFYETSFPERQGLIHADLHFGNLIWQKRHFAAIDFDDCGYGFYAYDVVIPLMGVRHLLRDQRKSKLYHAYKESLLEGYTTQMPWDEHDARILPHLGLARRLAMLGWLQSRSDNPRLRARMKKAIRLVLALTNTEIQKLY